MLLSSELSTNMAIVWSKKSRTYDRFIRALVKGCCEYLKWRVQLGEQLIRCGHIVPEASIVCSLSLAADPTT